MASIRKWSPNRLKRWLAARTVDASEGPYGQSGRDQQLHSAALWAHSEGGLKGWHVTDEPSQVLQGLKEGSDLQELRPWGDLCGGLYVSASPRMWRGRSRKKWEFLAEISPEKFAEIADLVVKELRDERETRYITESEFEAGARWAREAVEFNNPAALVLVADQPYNVDIPKLAREAGIADPFNPHEIEVVFSGRYLNMEPPFWNSNIILEAISKQTKISEKEVSEESVCEALREWGFDGGFTPSSFSTLPQLVIWNGEKVLQFGDWKR